MQTSGEIRVSVAPLFWGDVERTARRAFERLGMHRPRERNGVLLLVVPARRRFAILGDEGIHAMVGQAFWDELSEILSAEFREERDTEGLVKAITRVGERLREHFAANPADNPDELPNAVDVG